MKEETALDIYYKTISDYDKIADVFSQSRGMIWSDLEFLKKYYKKGDKILDFGCGNGRLIKFLNIGQEDYTGTDGAGLLIDIGKEQNLGYTFIQADFLNTPKSVGKFKTVFWIAGLHHIPSFDLREKCFKKVLEHLEKNGTLVLSCWNIRQSRYIKYILKNTLKKIFGFSNLDFGDALIPWREKEYIERYVHGFTLKELESLAKFNNLKILSLYKTKNNLILVAKK